MRRLRLPSCVMFVGVVLLLDAAGAAPDAATPADMVLIPAGAFVMGSDKADAGGKAREFGSVKPWYVDERPQRRVNLAAYYIDTYEVTNARYRTFVTRTNYWVPPAWARNGYLLSREVLEFADDARLRHLASEVFRLDADTSLMNRARLLEAIAQQQRELDGLPVTGVTWNNARDYCHWAGQRLPTEAEWEKAARGPDGREFPWGDQWDAARANAGEGRQWPHQVAPVNEYNSGVSYYGVYQMAGNVMEWVADSYGPYPGATYRSPAFTPGNKVVRGGGWGGVGHYAISHLYRGAYRFYLPEDSMFDDLGFRCAADVVRGAP